MSENNGNSNNFQQQQQGGSTIILHHKQQQQQQQSTTNNNNNNSNVNSHNENMTTILAQQQQHLVKQEIKPELIINSNNNNKDDDSDVDSIGIKSDNGQQQQQQRISIISQQNYSQINQQFRNDRSPANEQQQNHQFDDQQHNNQYYISTNNAVHSDNNNDDDDDDDDSDVVSKSNSNNHSINATPLPKLPPPQQNYVGSNNTSNISISSSTSVRSSNVTLRNSSSSPTNWHQPHSSNSQQQQQQQQQHDNHPQNAFGMLRHENDVLYITENCIEIGRNSSTSSVHFHVAKNSFVSRKHFQVLYEQLTSDFYVVCLSKNGVFVDDVFQRRSAEPMKLPKICTFRFPSTEIRISFESFTDKLQQTDEVKNNFNKNVENSNVIYTPLKISIPKTEQKSPFPSPTGTMSAANSCPTSPRQGFQEYQSFNSYNNNNNTNNNNNNSLQNDTFQPPASSSYNEHEKPPYSYAQLIVQSISAASDKQLTLSGIYSFISKHYPYYRKEANKGWQNSIRHNLSLNRYFIKVARSQDEPGKGSFWRIDPNSEAKLIDQSYKKRRQRGSQCLRPPYGMPRSAPVSPSHIDTSRSPLQDLVLQSAPGSPGMSYQSHSDNHGHDDVSFENTNIIQPTYNNSHNQYSNIFPALGGTSAGGATTTSTLTITNNQSGIHQKRHHQASTTISLTTSGDIYDEMPEYSAGGIDSDECDSTTKRTKYSNDINQ